MIIFTTLLTGPSDVKTFALQQREESYDSIPTEDHTRYVVIASKADDGDGGATTTVGLRGGALLFMNRDDYAINALSNDVSFFLSNFEKS